MHVKDPLLVFGKSSPCGGSGFLLSGYLSGPLLHVPRRIYIYIVQVKVETTQVAQSSTRREQNNYNMRLGVTLCTY